MSECHQCGSHSQTGQLTKYQSSELRTRTSLAPLVRKMQMNIYSTYQDINKSKEIYQHQYFGIQWKDINICRENYSNLNSF